MRGRTSHFFPCLLDLEDSGGQLPPLSRRLALAGAVLGPEFRQGPRLVGQGISNHTGWRVREGFTCLELPRSVSGETPGGLCQAAALPEGSRSALCRESTMSLSIKRTYTLSLEVKEKLLFCRSGVL